MRETVKVMSPPSVADELAIEKEDGASSTRSKREIGIEVIGGEGVGVGVLEDGETVEEPAVSVVPSGSKESRVCCRFAPGEEARGEGVGAVVTGGGVAEQIAVIEDVTS